MKKEVKLNFKWFIKHFNEKRREDDKNEKYISTHE